MRTLQQLAQEAIDVQNACNPLGLTNSLAKAALELRDLLGLDTGALCVHPVFRLWASKLHDLARMGLSNTDRYGESYDACLEMASLGNLTPA